MDTHFQLHDDLIMLRPPQPGEAAVIYAAVRESLPELQPWMDWASQAYSQASTQNWFEHVQLGWEHSSAFHFIISEAASGQILGVCGLDGVNEKNRFCNLGYWVRSSQTRRGIASRAARLAARFAFEKAGLIRTEIIIAVGNLPSQRAAEKAGAHFEGILKNRMVVRETVYDALMYSFCPADFGL